jgi:hypothetical protein
VDLLAFDNYDELTHTLSGADTLNDMMGIMYQAQITRASVPEEAACPDIDIIDDQAAERP